MRKNSVWRRARSRGTCLSRHLHHRGRAGCVRQYFPPLPCPTNPTEKSSVYAAATHPGAPCVWARTNSSKLSAVTHLRSCPFRPRVTARTLFQRPRSSISLMAIGCAWGCRETGAPAKGGVPHAWQKLNVTTLAVSYRVHLVNGR